MGTTHITADMVALCAYCSGLKMHEAVFNDTVPEYLEELRKREIRLGSKETCIAEGGECVIGIDFSHCADYTTVSLFKDGACTLLLRIDGDKPYKEQIDIVCEKLLSVSESTDIKCIYVDKASFGERLTDMLRAKCWECKLDLPVVEYLMRRSWSDCVYAMYNDGVYRLLPEDRCLVLPSDILATTAWREYYRKKREPKINLQRTL